MITHLKLIKKIILTFYNSYLQLYYNSKITIPMGSHSYGSKPEIIGPPHVAKKISQGSKIGCFCSIAPGLKFIFRGKHMVNWVTTYPFKDMWNLDVPLNDLPRTAPIIIGNDVWIASNVAILQGVTIGDGAVIAQESFVTKNVPPYAMVGGNPAQIIRYRFSDEQIAELLQISWWNWNDDQIRKTVPYLLSVDINEFIRIAKSNLSNEPLAK
jgi:acetyltransferase-like isoleucine patch superfamily enzyme